MNYSICLIGNPNAGKTTLINDLTGSQLRVGNWPGVTVEQKSGFFQTAENKIEVVDLPGIYMLTTDSDNLAIDEYIACHYLNTAKTDLIINVVDANNLERNLYLTTQLLERRQPMIVVLSMLDLLKERRINLDVQALSKKLGCPVIALSANRKEALNLLKQVIVDVCSNKLTMKTALPYSVDSINRMENADVILADARYEFATSLQQACMQSSGHSSRNVTTLIDSVVLHRLLGIPVFLLVVYLMFLFSINIGGAFQDFFDISSDTIFVQGLAHGLAAMHVPVWLIGVVAFGFGKGINTTITFIPVIASMFFFLALMETTGYMSRAAFVMDRLMRAMGLPGKSFVPLIIGFGCNVPAIMATRTLANHRDRILTVLMTPFMSCSARLAIYAVFTSAFFKVGGQNVVFALYLLGIFAAMLTGFILRKTLLPGDASPFIMELPPYHFPKIAMVLRQTWLRLKGFVLKAGKVIIPVCVLIGVLNSISWPLNGSEQNTLLSQLGRWLTPIFTPMGISSDNWPATVGLITGTLAKEVVVATLNSLYSQTAHLSQILQQPFDWYLGIKAAFVSIADNFKALPSAFSNPILASAKQQSLTPAVYGEMSQQFGGQAAAFAYLIFVLLYVPCVSTVAAISKELNGRWALFSVFWSTGLAYMAAVMFYQAATYARHPNISFLWISSLIALFCLTLMVFRYLATQPIYSALAPAAFLKTESCSSSGSVAVACNQCRGTCKR